MVSKKLEQDITSRGGKGPVESGEWDSNQINHYQFKEREFMEEKTEKKSTKPRSTHSDRIPMNMEALQKIDRWQKHIEHHYQGTRITRAEIANFVLLQHPDELSPDEMHQLGTKNFDDVRFTAWALQTLRQSRAAGKNTSLQELLEAYPKKS